MSVLARIRVLHPEPDPAPPAPPAPPAAVAAEGPELGDDDLEQVVGGLERIYVPGAVAAGS